MVFCCIAIVAIAIVYFIGLWIRQLFLGRHRDADYAAWLPPPRALAGNGAWPVYGHTRLFRRHVGDVALRFHSEWTECGRLSSRKLGDCFAIFIWGQWRVGIQGPERAQQFFQQQTLHEGWPWTPPVTLLGKSCLALLQQDDPVQAKGLRGMLEKPLDAKVIQRFAPLFARAAEQCLLAVEQGLFRKANLRTPKKQQNKSSRPCASPLSSNDDGLEDEDIDEEEDFCCKLKWEALRSYSLYLFDGPLFALNLWKNDKDVRKEKEEDKIISSTKMTTKEEDEESQPTIVGKIATKSTPKKHRQKDEPPSRELMLLWMERIKLGLDVIKLTFGPEWMYVWMFNEYGRAINARMYVEKLIGEHVERMVALVPQVTHERGHVYHEPTTQPFPLLTMHQNLMHSKEGIFGDFSVYPTPKKTAVGTEETTTTPGNRMRCNSMPSRTTFTAQAPPINDENGIMPSPYVQPFKTEQDLARPNYDNSPVRRPVTLKHNKSNEWMKLKEIHVNESHHPTPMSPLNDWGASPRRVNRKISLSPPSVVQTEPSMKSLSLDDVEEKERDGSGEARTHRQKKRVKEVFDEIKANREKQMHLSDENQVVYSFFNPAKRKSGDADTFSPILKAISTMPEVKSTEVSKETVLEKHEMVHEPTQDNAEQLIRCGTNVHKSIESTSQKPETDSEHTKAVSSSSTDSHHLDGRGLPSAPPKRLMTPQTPMASSFRQQKRMRSTSAGKRKLIPDSSTGDVCSLIEALLQQRGPEGKGISQTTLMELIINLWMMLEVGNAWTAMALNLLACDETALAIVQEELDVLEMEFGSRLFSPESLDQMKYLDALIYESIRLIPPFLGGLKSTTETVVFKDAGVQVPKGSHIFFCQPSRQEFDLFAAVGKRPECLGQKYPCIELFGFLPLQGLEVPLMVLQCKVFLIVTLRHYSPTVSKRKTFIRRVKSAVSFRKNHNPETTETSMHSMMGTTDFGDAESGSNYSSGAWDLEDGVGPCQSGHRMTPSEAMKRFTKIPFPEPKRVIQLKPRGL